MPLREQYPKANYSRLEFDDRTAGLLFDFCVENRLGIASADGAGNISAKDFKFHVTLIYSAVTHPSFLDTSFEIDPIQLIPKQFQCFGSDERQLVLEFDVDARLQSLFRHYEETFGHKSDFHPYRPHLTIKGTRGADDESFRGLTIPRFPMTACRIVHEVR